MTSKFFAATNRTANVAAFAIRDSLTRQWDMQLQDSLTGEFLIAKTMGPMSKGAAIEEARAFLRTQFGNF
jgi:hypothetical protein